MPEEPRLRVLVTGADGFVGGHLIPRLLAADHAVVGTRRAGAPLPALAAEADARVRWRELDLEQDASVEALAAEPVDAVVHLAALASGREARRAPGLAWSVNAAGTARLAEALAAQPAAPLLLLVSSGEVYGAAAGVADGAARRPFVETDPVEPPSPYAASKLGAEIAAREVARRTGLRLVVARPFAHTGPGQTPLYAIPAFARRLAEARRSGARAVPTGDLSPVRDILDVRDVAAAYLALLELGIGGGAGTGETFNVARGEGVTLADVFARLARLVGVDADPATDPALRRAGDISYLVGDATKLRRATGWRPTYTLDETLKELVDAQAD
ncbi:MAG TPA: NAD-dependent epimerase/dehydratase family protein [Gemmatimonadales bacterium]|nr:NAD-dependent epimerase/dehydratase family protein [Gemmatimonadales bacterium]